MKAWEAKDEADKTWVHLQSYFGDLWDANQQFGGLNAAGQGFAESANSATELVADIGVVDAMKEIALAATSNKEHIQQMSDPADELLAIIKRQQTRINQHAGTITKQQATITKLTQSQRNLRS